MTFSFDLETLFKVTAHLYPKALSGRSIKKIGPRARGEKIFSGQEILDGKQTDHYRRQQSTALKNLNSLWGNII